MMNRPNMQKAFTNKVQSMGGMGAFKNQAAKAMPTSMFYRPPQGGMMPPPPRPPQGPPRPPQGGPPRPPQGMPMRPPMMANKARGTGPSHTTVRGSFK